MGMNIAFAAIFHLIKDNDIAKQIFSKIKMLWILQLFIAFIPSTIYVYGIKPFKLFVAYGFGFDFFVLSSRDPQYLVWRFMTNLSHHLIVLCTDSYLEMIGYSICWSVHLFGYEKYIDGYKEKIVPLWKLGNHIPVFILLQYGYYYYVDTQPVNELYFFVCVQMVLYRYIFMTAAHAPYGLMKIEPFQTYIKQITKGMIILCFLSTVLLHVRFGIILAPIAISQVYYGRQSLKDL